MLVIAHKGESMQSIVILVAILVVAYVAYKLWAMFAKDRRLMAAIPDDQLIGHYNWELAEGRDGKKFASEYQRRHGSLPC